MKFRNGHWLYKEGYSRTYIMAFCDWGIRLPIREKTMMIPSRMSPNVMDFRNFSIFCIITCFQKKSRLFSEDGMFDLPLE